MLNLQMKNSISKLMYHKLGEYTYFYAYENSRRVCTFSIFNKNMTSFNNNKIIINFSLEWKTFAVYHRILKFIKHISILWKRSYIVKLSSWKMGELQFVYSSNFPVLEQSKRKGCYRAPHTVIPSIRWKRQYYQYDCVS